MSSDRGCLFNSCLFLIIIFIPLVGHIIETFMILEDDHSPAGKVLWLAVVWLLFPVIGPLLYLLFGQRRKRIVFGQSTYGYQQQYNQPYQR